MPVLSVQITEAEPSVSTEDSFFTIALCSAMRCTPSASTSDRMAGNPSGTAATASDTPNSRAVSTPCNVCTWPTISKVPITATAITITAMPSMRPMWRTSFCSGVSSSVSVASMWAMAPISVPMPVAVTTASPVPPATAVPL